MLLFLAMQPPQQITAQLVEILPFNERYIQYTFEYLQPPTVEFQAGQYISIPVTDQGHRRSYSIASSPDKNHGFELLVDISPGGVGSIFLQNLKVGDEIKGLMPLGVFTMSDQEDEQEVVMVATGSGVAPFRSMILDLLQQKHDQRKITLLWGMRQADHLFWLEEFEQLMQAFPNFKLHLVVSQPPAEWTLCRGRVTDCLSVHDFPVQAGYYLCGSQPMIVDVMAQLQTKGVPSTLVHHEKFF